MVLPIRQQAIVFPFDWSAASIRKLTDKELDELRERPHVCCMCRTNRVIYHKESGGTISYLCDTCALKYVERAREIDREWKFATAKFI